MIRQLLVAALLLFILAPAHADEISLTSAPIVVVYDAGDERVARRVADICEKEVGGLAAQLGLATVAPIRVEVVADMRPLRHAFDEQLPIWGVAFALLREQRIVVDVDRAARAYNSLDGVIPHELSHLLFAQKVGPVRFPVWFLEGLAQWQAGEWSLVDNWLLVSAVWSGRVLPLWQLVSRYPVDETRARDAYRLSYVAFTEMFRGRMEQLPLFLEDASERGFEIAFLEFTGVGFDRWMSEHRNAMDRKYQSWLFVFQTEPLFALAAIVFLMVGLAAWLRKRRRLKDLPADPEDVWLDGPSGPRV